MKVENFYQDKPVIPFSIVSVEMGKIIELIKSLDYPIEVKRSAYIFIRNETANGKSVICGTNVGGIQSDSGKWPERWDSSIEATCIKAENRTGNLRGFVVFNSLSNGIAFMCDRLQGRGLYIGGFAKKIADMQIATKYDLAAAYYKEWVTGEKSYKPTLDEAASFVSMYNQSLKAFI